MDRRLMVRERKFRAGVISRREFCWRAAVIAGGSAAAFELLGRLAPGRVARADFSGITLDLSTNDLAGQGYETSGTQPYSVDTVARRLLIGDAASTDHRFFRKLVPEIPNEETNVDIILGIDIGSVQTVGEDTGVHVSLNEGNSGAISGRDIRAVCIRRGAERRLALALSGGTFSLGLPFNWAVENTFRVRRLLTGDGVIEANGLIEIVPHALLAIAPTPVASFALGCFLDAAAALATFGPIGAAPPQVFPLTLTSSRCDLFPNAAEKVHFEGIFTLDAGSDGIDPAAEGVELRLFKPDGTRVYPVGIDTMPIAFEASSTGWTITPAEKNRTGIQAFTITGTADPMQFGFKLVDTRSGLQASDYSNVQLKLDIGNDSGSVAMNLVQSSNGLWRLA